MEQIQQHEWVGNYFLKVCVHCNCRKYERIDKLPTYQCDGYGVHKYVSEEPACITRPINVPLTIRWIDIYE